MLLVRMAVFNPDVLDAEDAPVTAVAALPMRLGNGVVLHLITNKSSNGRVVTRRRIPEAKVYMT